jgi:hypothetical protein
MGERAIDPASHVVPPAPATRPWFWTTRQRIGLAIIVLGILLFQLARYAANRSYVGQPAGQASHMAEVVDRVDPNEADWPALAALPAIGPMVARRIVQERQEFLSKNPGGVAFKELKDLVRVKGIGEATIENLQPYLMFPASDRPQPLP